MEQVAATREANQMKFQLDQAKLQIEQQDSYQKAMQAQNESQVKMQTAQLDAQLALQKQQFDEYFKQQELAIAQQEAQVKANAVQVEMMKVEAMAGSDQQKHSITQETARLDQLLELQKLELEQMRIRLSESEKLMEERRLASEQELERIRLAMKVVQPTATL